MENYVKDFPGCLPIATCLSRTWEVFTLEHLAPANIRSQALQTVVDLQKLVLAVREAEEC